ncbi:alginate O-acetyltransferase AlgX-related protein [Brumimicrobium mesophilum]|uniref:alginate O-acetyltransferase AlgX-related protein n=1 Tax=Brumimicrobium mesophilum TaxID=392717 RepID=UPI000D13F215|nr:hypothetical protein [Brumimicrobium mesophilum]
MKESKFIKYLLPFLFIIIIIAPALLSFSGIEGFSRKDENRSFKDSISININKLDNFPSDFDEFAADNFFFRSPLLKMFHYMKFYTFNISPHPEKAIIGRDGWMFKSGEELELISGKHNFSKDQLNDFSAEWRERKVYLDERNIPFFWIIAPMKHMIYTDKLPYNIHVSKSNRTEMLKKHMEKEFPNLILDPIPYFLSKKDSLKLYLKLDNHWNHRAAHLLTELILEKLRVQFPNKNIIDIPKLHWEKEKIQKGYHYNVMGIDELTEENELIVIDNPKSVEAEKYGFPIIEDFAYPWSYENRYTNTNLKNGLRVLIIRDSFGEAIIPLVREVFSETLLIFDAWEYKLNEEIIEKFKPDVVIFLGLETHIGNFTKDHTK